MSNVNRAFLKEWNWEWELKNAIKSEIYHKDMNYNESEIKNSVKGYLIKILLKSYNDTIDFENIRRKICISVFPPLCVSLFCIPYMNGWIVCGSMLWTFIFWNIGDYVEKKYSVYENTIDAIWHKLELIDDKLINELLITTKSKELYDVVDQDKLNLLIHLTPIDTLYKIDDDYESNKIERDSIIEKLNQDITFAFYKVQAELNEKIQRAKQIVK